MTRPLLLLPLLFALSASEARAETVETETPATSSACSKAGDGDETPTSRPATSAAKPAGTAAPVRSATPSRAAAPRWNSLLPGMFR